MKKLLEKLQMLGVKMWLKKLKIKMKLYIGGF